MCPVGAAQCSPKQNGDSDTGPVVSELDPTLPRRHSGTFTDTEETLLDCLSGKPYGVIDGQFQRYAGPLIYVTHKKDKSESGHDRVYTQPGAYSGARLQKMFGGTSQRLIPRTGPILPVSKNWIRATLSGHHGLYQRKEADVL